MKTGIIASLTIGAILVIGGISTIGGYSSLASKKLAVSDALSRTGTVVTVSKDTIKGLDKVLNGERKGNVDAYKALAAGRNDLAAATTAFEKETDPALKTSLLAQIWKTQSGLKVTFENNPSLTTADQSKFLMTQMTENGNKLQFALNKVTTATTAYNQARILNPAVVFGFPQMPQYNSSFVPNDDSLSINGSAQ